MMKKTLLIGISAVVASVGITMGVRVARKMMTVDIEAADEEI